MLDRAMNHYFWRCTFDRSNNEPLLLEMYSQKTWHQTPTFQEAQPSNEPLLLELFNC